MAQQKKENTLSGRIKDTASRSTLYLLKLKLSSTWLNTMSNCWDGVLGNWIGKRILKSLFLERQINSNANTSVPFNKRQ